MMPASWQARISRAAKVTAIGQADANYMAVLLELAALRMILIIRKPARRGYFENSDSAGRSIRVA